jgi:hypothetical protein
VTPWNFDPLKPSTIHESTTKSQTMKNNIPWRNQTMIYTLVSLLLFFWLVGLVAHVGGSFIHTLLVLALAVFLFDLITGRRAAL